MRKNDTVYYDTHSGTVRASVKCVHRDGTATVKSQFCVDDDGNDVNGYLGYVYRVKQATLRKEQTA